MALGAAVACRVFEDVVWPSALVAAWHAQRKPEDEASRLTHCLLPWFRTSEGLSAVGAGESYQSAVGALCGLSCELIRYASLLHQQPSLLPALSTAQQRLSLEPLSSGAKGAAAVAAAEEAATTEQKEKEGSGESGGKEESGGKVVAAAAAAGAVAASAEENKDEENGRDEGSASDGGKPQAKESSLLDGRSGRDWLADRSKAIDRQLRGREGAASGEYDAEEGSNSDDDDGSSVSGDADGSSGARATSRPPRRRPRRLRARRRPKRRRRRRWQRW